MTNWKTVSKKTLLTSKFFEVEQERIILPNGKEIDYDTVIRKEVSMIAPITKDNQVYLVKQFRRLFNDYILEFAAGHLDNTESPLDAAKRELREETGLEAREWKQLGVVYDSASVIESKVHLFLAKDLKELKANPEYEEGVMELLKIPLNEAVEMVTDGRINTLATMYTILLLAKLVEEKKL
jgi:ADP-ribose pyrophosphatase